LRLQKVKGENAAFLVIIRVRRVTVFRDDEHVAVRDAVLERTSLGTGDTDARATKVFVRGTKVKVLSKVMS
jgi:hypothetical protein